MDNKIEIEDLENYEAYGMKIREVVKYQDVFKSENGRDLNPTEDMVEVGEYDKSFTFDEEGNWTKLYLIGDDIGNGEFYFFIYSNKIYLDKGNLMLDENYHEMFKNILGQVYDGIDIIVDFRGLNK